MRVLGLDPSLTNFGLAVHDTEAKEAGRCVARWRWQTKKKQLFVTRYMEMRQRLISLITEHNVDRVGIEYPIFNALWSEGMYGLFLYSCEALYESKADVVFFTPPQVKALARESLGRPKGWKMLKADMVDTAKKDTNTKARWNHNEADAYLVARSAGRFFLHLDSVLTADDLSEVEKKMFCREHTFSRGKRAGQTVKSGLIHREEDRFFLWSNDEGGV